ncbi:MAG: OprD family porin [Epsilonproteobacteria bacterium]|nr:OprD family porin [Campylobacterota bacterium]
MVTKVKLSVVTALLLTSYAVGAENLQEAFSHAKIAGEIRVGAIQTENETESRVSTLALGGSLGIKTSPISGVSVGTTFYTTNALFGQNEEAMFLSSDAKSYSIVGEAYIQADILNTSIKVGRQQVDTPYADSDDIGMVPNRFEGISLINQDISDTTIVLASLDKWSGVDSDRPKRFSEMQTSGNALLTAAAIYEGLENTTLQVWHYKLDHVNFNYLEAGYETEQFNVGLQYTDQDNSNSAYGVTAGVTLGDLAFTTAYNRVEGEVTNGFGGGPFFTSSEDHTVAEALNQEAVLLGTEYGVNDSLTLGVTHVQFDKGENQTDYLVSYGVSDKLSLDVIHSDMYADGKMSRFFANYNF